MLRKSNHVEGRDGRPDYDVTFVAQRKLEMIWKFAMNDGKEDGVFRCGFAGAV